MLQAPRKSGQGQHGEVSEAILQLRPGPQRRSYAGNCSDLWGSTGHQASHRGAAKHGICFASRLVPSNVNCYLCRCGCRGAAGTGRPAVGPARGTQHCCPRGAARSGVPETITGSSPYIARRGLSELTIPGTAILPKLATEQFEGNARGVIANHGVSDPQAVSTPPRKPTLEADVSPKGAVEGDTESEAQGTVHSRDSKGVGDQPSHDEEIPGR